MNLTQSFFVVALLTLSAAHLTGQDKHNRPQEIFEATVVRVEPWGPTRISCGVAIVYRMAEYRVDAVLRGHLSAGDQVIVSHLACNGNELDDLSVGDKVVVFAAKRSKPGKRDWMTYKVASETDKPCPGNETEKCQEIRFAPGPAVIVRFDGLKIAKVIYPTARAPQD